MSTIVDPFFTQSPEKILEKAVLYSKTLQNFHELPLACTKSNAVRKNAQQHKNQIEFGIQQSQYQKQLYRMKETEDMKTREKYEKMIQLSQEKNEVNNKEIEKKTAKDAERYEKHLKEVYKRYDEEQKKIRDQEKEESLKLKKELIQFYEKQHHRKKQAHRSQINVGTCYQSAVERINIIHKKNEEYSKQAEQNLQIELKRNNHYGEIIREKRRSLSSSNKRKERQYRNSIDIYNSLGHSFIQKYGQNEDSSIKAWKAIDQECGKTTKRIGEFFKKRYERWSTDKKKVDEARQQISQRCTSILQKTNQATFRHTTSSFKSTAREWQDTVQKNKTAIKEFQEMQKDKIMSVHLDLRLKNQSTSKINDRMKVMRLQAKKLAYDFL